MQRGKGKRNEEGTMVSKRGKDSRGKEDPPHLYLLLDDWSWGYSIRRIDLSFGDPGRQPTLRLPPALFSFEAPRGYPRHFAGAYDSKILAMQPMSSKFKNSPMDGVHIYDVRMRSFMVGPRQNPDPVDPIYIPVRDRLFALAAGSFQLLDAPPYHESDWEEEFVWTWHALPEPPFSHPLITCYAVHSDRRTVFVSVQGDAPATFSFNTADAMMDGGDGGCWKEHGQWKMPFSGRAYFDAELDAWVGLSGQPDTIGHICSCDEVSTDMDKSHEQDLAVKLCQEKLFSEVPYERHIGATLVYMGGDGSEFCLLEGICIQSELHVFVDELNETDSDGEVYETDSDEMIEYSGDEGNEEKQDQKLFLRVTTFSLRYDKNGDMTTGNSCRVWYYVVPQQVTDSMLKHPVAFWM